VRACYVRPAPCLKSVPRTGLIQHRLIRFDWRNPLGGTSLALPRVKPCSRRAAGEEFRQ
jgi:hypothetical protein